MTSIRTDTGREACKPPMPGKKEYPIPEFATPEEERAYWDKMVAKSKWKWTHSPARKDREKLSSFLNIRMPGKEITELHQAARKHGLNISTYARMVLLAEIRKGGPLPLPNADRVEAPPASLAIAEAGNGLYIIDKSKVKNRQKLVRTLDSLLRPSIKR